MSLKRLKTIIAPWILMFGASGGLAATFTDLDFATTPLKTVHTADNLDFVAGSIGNMAFHGEIDFIVTRLPDYREIKSLDFSTETMPREVHAR